MSDPYKKAQPGERLVIPAQTWNRLLDSISIPVQTGGELGSLEQAPNTVLIKNASGGDVPRFGVLGIAGVAVDPTSGPTQEADFARRPVVRGVTPTTTGHADRFAVCLEPIKNDSIGKAAIGGVFACQVYVQSTTHRFATVRNNDRTQLDSASCGLVQLLWVASTGVTGPTGSPGPVATGPTGPYHYAVAVM